MGRLVNLGTGEVTDRLTVLALKILHYGAAGKPVDYLEAERASLLAKVRAQTLNGAWFEQALELGAVNAALWGMTDQLRETANSIESMVLITAGSPQRLQMLAGELGVRIMRLNDRRAQLVEAINKLTGEHLGSEKG